MVLTALSEVGGVEYLVKQANENPEVFCRLLSRCIPQAVEVKVEDDVRVVLDFSGGQRRQTPVGIDETPRLPELARSN
jgi:hypothetical protein